MSWSSKIIVDGTTENSQRRSGRRAVPADSATASPAGSTCVGHAPVANRRRVPPGSPSRRGTTVARGARRPGRIQTALAAAGPAPAYGWRWAAWRWAAWRFRRRPTLFAVDFHAALNGRSRRQVFEDHERIVVPAHLKGGGGDAVDRHGCREHRSRRRSWRWFRSHAAASARRVGRLSRVVDRAGVHHGGIVGCPVFRLRTAKRG